MRKYFIPNLRWILLSFVFCTFMYVQGDDWTFNDGTLNVTGQIWGQSYESSTSTTGALKGEFSVSPTKTVHFSKGNLQYNAALGTHQCADGIPQQGTWRFAEHQWDYVGSNNSFISSTYDGWIDLFGWGTSGWNSGANSYQPWSTSTSYNAYYPGGSYNNNLTGNYANADWGVYNQIGTDAPGTWRTLTRDEWIYLFHDRANAEKLFGLGTVNGVKGIIILPDGWVAPSGVTFYPSTEKGLSWQGDYYFNSAGNNYSHNSFVSGPSGTWDAMASNGAVFLPTSGGRKGTTPDGIGSVGFYWSSTADDNQNTYYQYFSRYYMNPQSSYARHWGYAVRLVTELSDAPETFTVTFVNYDGSELQSSSVAAGTMPSYNGETPTKPADEQYTYSFIGWDADIVAVTGEATYTAQFESIPVSSSDEIYIHDGEDPDICDIGAHTYTHIIIEPGGKLNIFSSCIHVGVITIISTGIQSGQIHHGSIPVPTDRIFMEYVLNPFGTAASPKLWYAFAVPFEVDIETGITRAFGSQSHISGTDFLIKEYDGMLRATTGKGWRSKLTGTLEPGHLYMIGIEGDCNRWLFEKKSGAAFEGNNHMQIHSYIADNSNDNKQNGWNALGNTQLEYTSMNLSGLGIEYLFTYNSRFDKYDIGLVSGASLCVGQPFFIQALADGEFDFIHQSATNNMPALYADNHAQKPLMHFTLTDEGHTTGIDNMFITMHDDADGTYTIGRDVARMTTNCTTATQLWCTMSDGTELSAHGIEFPETETIVPLTLFAPKDGEYFVNMSSRAINGYAVELLFQGTYLATMFDGQPVTLDLNAGNNSGYALRISRRNMLEGLNDVQGDYVQSTKVIMNDHLYILRAGQVYDAQGKKVK